MRREDIIFKIRFFCGSVEICNDFQVLNKIKNDLANARRRGVSG